jgi:peroxiredoxin
VILPILSFRKIILRGNNMSERELQIGDVAVDCELTDANDQMTPLATLWQRQPTFILFLRHFNCPHCREQVRQFHAGRAQVQAAGLSVALVGLGRPERARAFCDDMQIDFPVLCDPDKRSYAAYNLLRANPFRELNPNSVRRYITALQDTRASGVSLDQDMVQLGGTFIIDAGGIIRYAHRAMRIGDNPTPDDALGEWHLMGEMAATVIGA